MSMALATPAASAPPWLFSTMPFRPSSGPPFTELGSSRARILLKRAGRQQRARPWRAGVEVSASRRVAAEEPRHALGGLQRHVAGEAVGDDHVHRALGDVVALHEAAVVEVEVAPPRSRRWASRTSSWPFMSSEPTLSMPTLGRLPAPSAPCDGAVEGLAHDGELDQLRGVAVDVGAHVEHGGDAAQRRPAGHDRRPLQPARHAQEQLGDGHQGAGVAAARPPPAPRPP